MQIDSIPRRLFLQLPTVLSTDLKFRFYDAPSVVRTKEAVGPTEPHCLASSMICINKLIMGQTIRANSQTSFFSVLVRSMNLEFFVFFIISKKRQNICILRITNNQPSIYYITQTFWSFLIMVHVNSLSKKTPSLPFILNHFPNYKNNCT